jgi:putative flippase GtrA
MMAFKAFLAVGVMNLVKDLAIFYILNLTLKISSGIGIFAFKTHLPIIRGE